VDSSMAIIPSRLNSDKALRYMVPPTTIRNAYATRI